MKINSYEKRKLIKSMIHSRAKIRQVLGKSLTGILQKYESSFENYDFCHVKKLFFVIILIFGNVL